MLSWYLNAVDRRVELKQSKEWSRRGVLGAAAALAPIRVLAQQRSEGGGDRGKFSDYPFKLGVSSGDPSHQGFVIWTRLAPDPIQGGGMPTEDVRVEWEVADDRAMSKVVAKGEVRATAALAHAVHAEVEGLAPDRWYFYRFRAGGEVSPVGRARTAPDPNMETQGLRFAFASCQHYEPGYYTAFEHMSREDLDFVVHLGDYIYEGPGSEGLVRKHTGNEIQSLDDYRNRHALYRSDKDLQAAHHACPWIVTWDDHEVDNNYADAAPEEADVGEDAFLARRAQAYQAYYEHMPLRLEAKPRGADMQLYRNVPFGRLLEFQVLDTRQYRSDQPCGDKNGPECEGVFDPRTSILGEQQEDWLYSALRRSPARWNAIAQQVMVARVDRVPGDRNAYSMDKWSAYRHGLDRFLSFLDREKPSNPIVLTGDIHSNWVCDLMLDFADPKSKKVGTEYIGTSISSSGDGSQNLEYDSEMRSENPCVRFYNGERGYVSCEVTPHQWRSKYQVVEYVSKPGAPLVTRAEFVTENGRPGVQRA